MIGTKGLTEKGDQLMGAGVYAKREVSADFAEGYEKGLSSYPPIGVRVISSTNCEWVGISGDDR
jgi:hypothetical protein